MRIRTALVTTIILLPAVLACSLARGTDAPADLTATPAVTAPTATSEPLPTASVPTATAEPTAVPPAATREQLGQIGLSYALPDGYEPAYAWNRVSFQRPGADPLLDPLIEIDANPYLCTETVPGDLYEAMETALLCATWSFDEGTAASDAPSATTVSGLHALTAEVAGTQAGAPMRLRLTVLKPGPTRVLVIRGRAATEHFEGLIEELEALSASMEILTWQTLTNGNDVTDVAFHDGYLWAATGGGVVAWPLGGGIDPVKYTVADGLPSNDVRALTVCPVGGEFMLFAGTWGGGVARYEPGRWRWISMDDPYAEWSDRHVTALACALGNRLVVGYEHSDVDLLNLDETLWTTFSRDEGVPGELRALAATPAGSDIWLIGEEGLALISDVGLIPETEPALGVYYQAGLDSMDNLWVAAWDRLIRRTPEGEWTDFDQREIEDLFHVQLTGLAVAADDTIWLGSYNQLSRFDPVEGEVVEVYWLGDSPVPGGVGRLAVDPYYDWVAYSVPGVGAAVLKDGEWMPFVLEDEPLHDNHVRALAQDSEGHLWMADRSGRLWVVDPVATAVPLERYDVPRGFAFSITPDAKEGVWVGHFDGASLYTLEGALHLADVVPQLTDVYVRAIARDATGRLWLGGDEGLFIWDEVRLTEMTEVEGLPGTEVRALQADGDAMWVGTTQGLARIEGAGIDTFAVRGVDLPGELIGALALDRWGHLLVATGSTLLVRDADGAFEPLLQNAWDSPLTAIAVGADGEIWVTTALDGVYTLQYHGEAGDWLHLSGKDGLPGNAYGAYSVILDRDGIVWLGGTSGGLGRYGP